MKIKKLLAEIKKKIDDEEGQYGVELLESSRKMLEAYIECKDREYDTALAKIGESIHMADNFALEILNDIIVEDMGVVMSRTDRRYDN